MLDPGPGQVDHHPMSLDPNHRLPEITDENLDEAKAAVRYQQIQRYERIHSVCERRIVEDESGDRPIDPRFLEIDIRVLKEQAMLYRLNRVTVAEAEEEDVFEGVDRAAVIEASLKEVEQKLRDHQTGFQVPDPAPQQ